MQIWCEVNFYELVWGEQLKVLASSEICEGPCRWWVGVDGRTCLQCQSDWYLSSHPSLWTLLQEIDPNTSTKMVCFRKALLCFFTNHTYHAEPPKSKFLEIPKDCAQLDGLPMFTIHLTQSYLLVIGHTARWTLPDLLPGIPATHRTAAGFCMRLMTEG